MDQPRINKVYAIIIVLIGTLAFAGVLYGCSNESGLNPNVISGDDAASVRNINGAVIPHHLLVSKDIDLFYESLSESYSDIENIVVISPNHFAYGLSYIQTTNVYPGYAFSLNLDLINILNGTGVVRIEPKYFPLEHGIFAHFDFIQRYFQDADISPIIIKRDTPKERLDLLARILKEEIPDNTLIISSIDFTHFEPEEVA